MDSNNIKIVDEHNIDRIGQKICAIDVDGSNYIVYSIERDVENDNIFVSKLLNNLNNTASMINIEDSMEKEKLSLIVKELIKYAVSTEEHKLNNNFTLVLNGTNVSIISVVIDSKEQNINVSKTYITTVKKTVSKVSKDFYDIEIKQDNELFNDNGNFPIFENDNGSFSNNIQSSVMPESAINKQIVPEEHVVINNSPVMNEINNYDDVNKNTNVVMPGEQVSSLNNLESSVDSASTFSAPSSDFFNIPNLSDNVVEKTNTEPAPINSTFTSDSNLDVSNKVVSPLNNVSADSMVFDASKESNLNEALGEVTLGNNLSVENLNSVREFGMEQPTESTNSSLVEGANPSVSVGNTGKSGFASSKILAIISIVLFIGVCIFLGYEMFNYFQTIK